MRYVRTIVQHPRKIYISHAKPSKGRNPMKMVNDRKKMAKHQPRKKRKTRSEKKIIIINFHCKFSILFLPKEKLKKKKTKQMQQPTTHIVLLHLQLETSKSNRSSATEYFRLIKI